MSQFITRAFSDGNDESLQLGKEEWVRTLAIGNAWNQIRIGILFTVNPVTPLGTSNLTGGFIVGICSGKTNAYGSPTTTNFVGISTAEGTLSYSANGGQPVWNGNGTNFAVTKINNSRTTATLGGGYNVCFPVQGQGSNRRFIFIVDILKGSPNYTLTMIHIGNSGGAGPSNLDYTVPDLKSALVQITSAPIIQGFSMEQHGTTIAASEVAGNLDTVNVFANLAANPFELYEVAIEKLA